jgi:hypothetical protein
MVGLGWGWVQLPLVGEGSQLSLPIFLWTLNAVETLGWELGGQVLLLALHSHQLLLGTLGGVMCSHCTSPLLLVMRVHQRCPQLLLTAPCGEDSRDNGVYSVDSRWERS